MWTLEVDLLAKNGLCNNKKTSMVLSAVVQFLG